MEKLYEAFSVHTLCEALKVRGAHIIIIFFEIKDQYPSNTAHIYKVLSMRILIINRALIIFCLLFLTYIPGEVFLTMEEDDQVSSP